MLVYSTVLLPKTILLGPLGQEFLDYFLGARTILWILGCHGYDHLVFDMLFLDRCLFRYFSILVKLAEKLAPHHSGSHFVADFVKNEPQRINILFHIDLKVCVLWRLGAFSVVRSYLRSHVNFSAGH